jgi:predicted acetyltransferase
MMCLTCRRGSNDMGNIRRIQVNEAREMAIMLGNAYPNSNLITNEAITSSEERIIKIHSSSPIAKYYGYFEGKELLGGMRLYDYNIKMLSTRINIGGAGGLAVNLLHKKEKIAKDMISYFIDYYRKSGYAMAMLYPFRPDFYKQMGFGFGTRMNQYSLKPSVFPKFSTKEHLHFYKVDDKRLIMDFYKRIFEIKHGMVDRPDMDWDYILDNLENKIIYYKRNDKIEGYIVFKFKRASEINKLKNNIIVTEMLYENKEALYELLYFLNTQEDQINRIVMNVLDEDFHYLFKDPRNESDNLFGSVYHETNIQGIGLMYRVINIKKLFEQLYNHNFGDSTIKLALEIQDSLIPENSGITQIEFKNGIPSLMESGEVDVHISMDISDFSSLIMGTISFNALVRFGLIHVSDNKYIDQMNELFKTKEKPTCLVAF